MEKAKSQPQTVTVSLKYALGMLLLLLLLAAGSLYVVFARLSVRIDKVNRLASDTHFQLQLANNELDYRQGLQRPVIVPHENLVVFPDLKLALPYDDTTKTLQYSYDDESQEASVTSTLTTDHVPRQLSCIELVRLNFRAATPRSPWEEAAGSVKLADGRTLYIFAAKAFRNDQASTEDCATQVWRQLTPRQVADTFKQAQTY